MRSDAIGGISVRWDAFGHFLNFFGFLQKFWRILIIFGRLFIWGVDYYAKLRVQGLIVLATYSGVALTPFVSSVSSPT